eukprot:CAMPEP_0178523134 /NCGR_PEP_ID=MMETSP0696-20121128/28921_1 /TAXON_ID=265572 /ORGANISM="Extubocellulus spinifer, Strain CCMP396" /LENGTH=167 /DNA_ID=CAMNT_0020154329 /DNA_START=136 /DNA_END=639 /DNA_ORIENTATION=-
MTCPNEKNYEDDVSDVSADIIEQAYSTDSMKKFHGKSTTTGSKHTTSRRGKKKKKESSAETDDGHDSDDAVRSSEVNGDGIEGNEEDDILEEVYATDSLKRLQKKSSSATAPSPRGRTRQKRAEGLNSIREDRSAQNLVEGLRSFRLDNERLREGKAKQKSYTSKVA